MSRRTRRARSKALRGVLAWQDGSLEALATVGDRVGTPIHAMPSGGPARGTSVKQVCVFTGSSPGAQRDYALAARSLGAQLAARDCTLIYGGANVGLMGVLADSVLALGGTVVGVIPEGLLAKEVAHQGLSDLRLVGSMHERKSLMAELSDGVVALPGGLGTLEEFFEMLTWAQLGLHSKPCGLLNVRGYFDRLLDFLEHAVEERFVTREHRQMIIADASPVALLDRMERYDPPSVTNWLDRETS